MLHYAGQVLIRIDTKDPVILISQEAEPDGDYYTKLTVMDSTGESSDVSPKSIGPLYATDLSLHKRSIFHGKLCSFQIGKESVDIDAAAAVEYLSEVTELLRLKKLKSKQYSK